MSPRSACVQILAALVLALGSATCNLLLGLDNFTDTTGTGGSTSATGTSSTGAEMICAPGTTQPCYDGPSGTADAGACKPGTQTCNAKGTDWGSCTGEVKPQPETCASTEDEDCDGHDCVL